MSEQEKVREEQEAFKIAEEEKKRLELEDKLAEEQKRRDVEE